MPLVTIEMLPGRSDETKARMAEAVTKAMNEIGGGSREHCWVIFRETTASNWSNGGEMLNSEAFAATMKAFKGRVNT